MAIKTHYDRLYERKGISKKVRDAGNARMIEAKNKRDAAAQALVDAVIAKAKG